MSSYKRVYCNHCGTELHQSGFTWKPPATKTIFRKCWCPCCEANKWKPARMTNNNGDRQVLGYDLKRKFTLSETLREKLNKRRLEQMPKTIEVIIKGKEEDKQVVLTALLAEASDHDLRTAFSNLTTNQVKRVAQKLHGVIYNKM